jgi:hypothetical protein
VNREELIERLQFALLVLALFIGFVTSLPMALLATLTVMFPHVMMAYGGQMVSVFSASTVIAASPAYMMWQMSATNPIFWWAVIATVILSIPALIIGAALLLAAHINRQR